MLHPEQRIVAQSLTNAGLGVDDLSDQRVVGVFQQQRRCRDQEKSGDEKERESVILFFFFFFFGFVSLCIVKSFFIKLKVLVRVGSLVTLFRIWMDLGRWLCSTRIYIN